MSTATELLRRALEILEWADEFSGNESLENDIRTFLTVEPEANEPVAWRDHVETRIRGWRSSQMNSDGDRLSIIDLMNPEEIDDLVDYVCDEYTRPEPARKPMTEDEIIRAFSYDGNGSLNDFGLGAIEGVRFAERYHGIGRGME